MWCSVLVLYVMVAMPARVSCRSPEVQSMHVGRHSVEEGIIKYVTLEKANEASI